jgi:hypothetical protein
MLSSPLNLERLNLRAPYVVWESSGEYLFKTDFGINYSVGFDLEPAGLGVKAYWFNLTNRDLKNSPNDSKLRATVVCIIEEFFKSNPDILLYLCDTAENQQAMRARLFFRWFETYGEKQQFIIRTALVESDEESNYVALIVQRNHPQLETILQLFDSEIGMFQSNKP